MDDASLCLLIGQALNDPKRAEILALAIDQLPEVKRYLNPGWQPYYEQALPTTQKDVQRNINKFPQISKLNMGDVDHKNTSDSAQVRKCFINWVLMILKRDCHDVKRKKRPIIVSTDTPIGKDGLTIEQTIDSRQTWNLNDIPTLDDLDIIIAEEEFVENQKKVALIQSLLEEKLSNCYPAGCPQGNCYELVQRRLLRTPPQQWQEIAKELQTPYGTVTAHWNRKCKPLLSQIEQNQSL